MSSNKRFGGPNKIAGAPRIDGFAVILVSEYLSLPLPPFITNVIKGVRGRGRVFFWNQSKAFDF